MPENSPPPPPPSGPQDSAPTDGPQPADTPIFKPPRMEHVTAGREPAGTKRADRNK